METNAHFDTFHSAIDAMVMANQYFRLARANVQSFYSPVEWATQHATVRSDIGRQTGKSEYIRRRAKPGDLVIAFSLEIRAAKFERMPCTVITAKELAGWSIAPERFQTIYVDEAALVFGTASAAHMYLALAQGYDQPFVLLGS